MEKGFDEMKYFVGIDLGGTKTIFSLASYSSLTGIEFIKKERLQTLLNCPRTQIERFLYEGVSKMLQQSPERIESIGISCGGPIDSVNGVILNPPNLYGWENFPIVALLSVKFGCPVYLQNDANACALAEWNFGAGVGCRNLVFLTMGTGMGAGLILNNRLYSGANDMAGEIGHVRIEQFGPVGYGKIGSFEGFCSGNGIAQLAKSCAIQAIQNGVYPLYCRTMNDLDSVTALSVARAAKEGDVTASEVYRIVGRALGKGLSILIDVLNPEVILIGSIFTKDKELMAESMKEVIQEEALQINRSVCRISPIALGDMIGAYGSITVALYGGGLLDE